MKARFTFFLIPVLAMFLQGFAVQEEIPQCYISFKPSTSLTPAKPERLPEDSRVVRTVETQNGETKISRVDGYRVLYNNEKKVPFVNLKVELSEKNAYNEDKKHLIENLKYMNSVGVNMETKDLIEMEFNGYKIYGLSRSSIEKGSTLGTFAMFPENRVIVYFYFNNLKPEYSNFRDAADYKKQRDRFMREYTAYLKNCEKK